SSIEMAESSEPVCFFTCSLFDEMCTACASFRETVQFFSNYEGYVDEVEREETIAYLLTYYLESETETEFDEADSDDEEEEKMRQEAVEQIQREREEEHVPSALSIRYSRRCDICFFSNPPTRVAFISCGHLSCIHCAKHLAETGLILKTAICPFCRNPSKFVRIFEEEYRPSPPSFSTVLLSPS
ncbi:hypothetical protein PFISCL1PPCAC_28858, partial [Pristionchus fissidentatus]